MEKTNFIDKFTAMTGISKSDALELLNKQKSSVLILNTLKQDKEKLDSIAKSPDLKPVENFSDVYEILHNKKQFTMSTEFAQGYYYIQNLSSLLPVLALNPKSREKVLDLCAAPGGKSFNICRLSANFASLSVNEAEKHRMQDLKQIIKIYELNVENILLGPGQGLFRTIENKFNKILLDAPCSAEGLISEIGIKNPKYWNQKKVKNLRNLQKKLINSAYHLLGSNGTLVYSTCTYSPEENEEVIDWLLKTYKDIEVEEITEFDKRSNFVPALQKWEKKVFNKSIAKCMRVLPDELYEGFFVAKLKKLNN